MNDGTINQTVSGESGICIELRGGQTAIVDEADADAVLGYNWTWMPGRGVAAYFHNQTILMHNLIAPMERVSFRDGNKLNCQRKNLIAYKPIGRKDIWMLNPRLGKGKHIWEDREQQRYVVHRKVVEKGQRIAWNTSISYWSIGKVKALCMARKVAKSVKALTREDFISFVKFSRSKKTENQAVYDAVTEWSAFGGAPIKMGGYDNGELAQLGLSNRNPNRR